MELLLFPLGVALTFWPIYRLLGFFWPPSQPERRRRTAALSPTPKQEFVESLRSEAAVRARAVARTAVAKLRSQTGLGKLEPVDLQMAEQLEESRRTVRLLLSDDAASTFDQITEICSGPFAGDLEILTRLILEFDQQIGGVVPPPSETKTPASKGSIKLQPASVTL